MPPRAQFIKKALFFIWLKALASIKSCVSGVKGQCKLKKSTCGNSSDKGTRSAISGRFGNDAIITFIPNAWANFATALPNSPYPTSPNVLPESSIIGKSSKQN